MGEWLQLKTRDGIEISAYRARPDGEVKGGLVVVQEIFGINAHIRGIVEGFAAEGYVTIAPALFDRYQPGVELQYEGEDAKKAGALYRKLNPQTALLDVVAAFDKVKSEGAGTGVVGYCYGGFMAWLAATRGVTLDMTPRCAIGYYPGGIGTVAKEQPSCPALLHFGGRDAHIGLEQIDAVRDAHPEVRIYIYDDAEHGFNCDARASYNPVAATLARERTLAFLAKNIG